MDEDDDDDDDVDDDDDGDDGDDDDDDDDDDDVEVGVDIKLNVFVEPPTTETWGPAKAPYGASNVRMLDGKGCASFWLVAGHPRGLCVALVALNDD